MPNRHVIACKFGVLEPRENCRSTGRMCCLLPGAPLVVGAVGAAMDSRGSSDAELKELKSISTHKSLTATKNQNNRTVTLPKELYFCIA